MEAILTQVGLQELKNKFISEKVNNHTGMCSCVGAIERFSPFRAAGWTQEIMNLLSLMDLHVS